VTRFLLVTIIILFSFNLAARPLSGNYTIGGDNPDFATISEAVAALETNGVSGPVTFNLREGIYLTNGGSEKALHISQNIPGASPVNTITFQADEASGANVEKTILRRTTATNSPGSSELGWVALIQSKYITLRNLTFEYANADTTANGVDNYHDNVRFQPASGSSLDSITVSGCRFVSSGNLRPYSALGFEQQGSHILIEKNHFERAGDGVAIERCNGCSTFDDVVIQYNKFRNLKRYSDVQNTPRGTAISISNGSRYAIIGNDIDYENVSDGITGIKVIGADVTISGNRIRNLPLYPNQFDNYTGLHLRSTGGDWLVSNNMISNLQKHTEGIHLENSSNMKIYNNTVVLTFDRFERQYGLVLQSVSDIDIKNNVLMVAANNYENNRLIQSYGNVSNITSDYNLLYSPRFHINFDGLDYDSLAIWQTTGNGANSRDFEPEFVDLEPYRDVHLGYCSLGDSSLWGIPLTEVTTDFDGEARDPQNPYMGADEVDSFNPEIFSPVNLTSIQDKALSFATGDLDNDGDDDLVVVNTYATLEGAEDISIFWNDGQGHFSSPVHFSMGVQPSTVKIWDIDNDGFLDLIATANGSNGMPVIRWGQGNGDFEAPHELPPYPSAALGDVTDLEFNSPHFLSFTHFGTVGVDSGWISFCQFDPDNRWFYYDLTPEWQPRRAGMHPANIVNGDVNGDSLIDVIVNDYVTGKTTTFEYLGPTGGMAPLQEIAVDIGTEPIHANMAVGDLDGDNSNDVVIGAWADGVDSLVWLRNDGTGHLILDYIPMDGRRLSQTFSLMDYENDGAPDIISATTSDDVILYRNDGLGNFTIHRLCQSSGYGGLALTSLVGDFNNDPYPDVAVLTQDNIASMLNLNYTVGIGEDAPEPTRVPQRFAILQNFPNPFNPTTHIQFSLSSREFAVLKVFDLLGREVKTLMEKNLSAGDYKVKWDGTNNAGQPMSSGVYLYRLRAGKNYVKTRKMLLLR